MNARDYIFSNYKQGDPIFLEDLTFMGPAAARQAVKRMVDNCELCRYCNGIYFIPGKTILGTPSSLSIKTILKEKYLQKEGEIIGYIGGYKLANAAGITSQVPALYEIYTNKATTAQRKTKINKFDILIKKPKIAVTSKNYKILQTIDLISNSERYSEIDALSCGKKIMNYMESESVQFDDLEAYLYLFQNNIFEQLYKMGLLVWSS